MFVCTCSVQRGVVANSASTHRRHDRTAPVDTTVCALFKLTDDQCDVTLTFVQLTSVTRPAHVGQRDGPGRRRGRVCRVNGGTREGDGR